MMILREPIRDDPQKNPGVPSSNLPDGYAQKREKILHIAKKCPGYVRLCLWFIKKKVVQKQFLLALYVNFPLVLAQATTLGNCCHFCTLYWRWTVSLQASSVCPKAMRLGSPEYCHCLAEIHTWGIHVHYESLFIFHTYFAKCDFALPMILWSLVVSIPNCLVGIRFKLLPRVFEFSHTASLGPVAQVDSLRFLKPMYIWAMPGIHDP